MVIEAVFEDIDLKHKVIMIKCETCSFPCIMLIAHSRQYWFYSVCSTVSPVFLLSGADSYRGSHS